VYRIEFEEAPMSSSGFDKVRLGRVQDQLAAHVERGAVPGAVTALSRHGEVHVETIGATAYDGGRPMARDTVFRLSSMTKPITAVAALILVEECRLRLDDPVDELLPELAQRRVLRSLEAEIDDTVAAVRPILVRDLLDFTWGFGLVLAEPAGFRFSGRSRSKSVGSVRRSRRNRRPVTSGSAGSPPCRYCTSRGSAGPTTPAPTSSAC
jgi:CubicO group peptidase (beta-lactamase class C family)